tara:strand:- start:79309 stop:80094 length:786 start_codon:yes stop_codon:yes gene_type:complete
MQNEFEKYVRNHLNYKGTMGDNIIQSIGKPINTQSIAPNYDVDASLTPYILEERELRVTQMDIFSRLMMDRIIWIAGPINDAVSTVVQAQLLFLESLEKDKDVTLHLDTPGGSVKSGLSIIDSMENANFDIMTVNTGMCASMGSVMLAAGTKGKRNSLRFSKVMTHQVSHGTQGNVQATRIDQLEAEKYNYVLFQKLAQYSGKTWKEVMDYSKQDRWFTSDEAKGYGLIDEVILKEGTKSMTDLLKGFDEYEKYIKDNMLN